MSIQISKMKVVGCKRIKAVEVDIAENDLVVFGGKNRQGKTSMLDSVAWCLGGGKFAPSNPVNEESETLEITVILNDGTSARRGGKNAALTAVDSRGKKLNQSHLNDKVGAFSLNLQKFMDAPAKEKADALLAAIGVGDKLTEADAKIDRLYQRRETFGQSKTAKEKYAAELPVYKDAPKEKVSVSELMAQHKENSEANAQNNQQRATLEKHERMAVDMQDEITQLQATLDAKELALINLQAEIAVEKKAVSGLVDCDLTETESAINASETVNAQVSANEAKAAAVKVAKEMKAQYDVMTGAVEEARRERLALMDVVTMPMPEMSVEHGELLYRGQKWDCMSDSERIIVSISLARAINPECGFTTANRFEQLDIDTQNEVREWCKREGFQVIAARVSTNPEECTLIIEDGRIKD